MEKKLIAAAFFTFCIAFFSGCQKTNNNVINNNEEISNYALETLITEERSDEIKELEPGNFEFVESEDSYGQESGEEADNALNSVVLKEEKTIDGYIFVDGDERPVKLKIGIENILRGEEAYNQLYQQNLDIQLPDENEEYIIVIFNVSYDEGEKEELLMMENRASLEAAGLFFSLSNSESNAHDVTSCLTNNIYNVSIQRGQSAQGAVAFLQEKSNTQPLYFIGFENIVEFRVNEF